MLASLDSDLESTLFPDLRILTNMTDATTLDMHNVCNYIVWAQANSIKLKFDLTEDQFSQCEVSYQRKVYQKFDATDENTYLAQAELLEVLDEFAHIIFE